jgi:signal transduction histidine kinase/integral membrane sensor domain MASE1
LLFGLSHPHLWTGQSGALWFPPAGLALVLLAWQGWLGLGLAVVVTFLLRVVFAPADAGVVAALWEALLLGVEVGGAWWLYQGPVGGSRRVNDPRSATMFLLLVPGLAAGLAALARAWLTGSDTWQLAGAFWISHAIGFLTLAPPLLVFFTPLLARAGLTEPEPVNESTWIDPCDQVALGDWLEMAGLTLGGIVLGSLLAREYLGGRDGSWQLWAMLLLVVVWASLRQGLRGGSLAACGAALSALVMTGNAAPVPWFGALQGNLLALASTALLVGASSGWIRASELRYRQIVGHIPVVLYSARVSDAGRRGRTPDAQILLVSAACHQIFSCPPEKLIGPYDRWLERVHPEDRELVAAALVQLGRQRGLVRCEYRLNPEFLPLPAETSTGRAARTPLPHGIQLPSQPRAPRDRWVRDTLAPDYDTDGRLRGWEGVVEDITTQRLLAHELQRTTTMLHTLVANLPAGVFFVHGSMGLPLLVNTRARQLLGQREDLSAGITHLPRVYRLYRPDGTLYPWEELPVYKALHQGLTSMRDDIVIHRPDGRFVPLVAWGAPIDLGGGGNIEAAVWVFEDLTSMHQAEAARLDSEARLRTIIETMAEGLVILDPEGVILECNPAACATLGLKREQLLGRRSLGPDVGWLREDGTPFPRNQHPDVVCRTTREPVRNVVAGIPHPSGDGGTAVRWVLVNCVPLSTGQTGRAGFLQRTVVTFADVTSSRRMLSDLERVQRLETAARLASGFVHDFNNLLTAILCLSQMARMKLVPGHPLIPDLETIQAAAEEAGRLAAQLLSFSKQRPQAFRPVDPNQAVERTLELLRSSLPENIEVEIELSPAPLCIMADESQLQQIIMNLCLNARDAMPRGGRLTISTHLETGPAPEPVNGTQSLATGEFVRLSVRDTGQGMDQNLRDKIFAPFFSTKERGTGLGLAVVHHLVDGFRGCIQLWSEPGQGTRFDVWLPVCAPDAAPRSLPLPSERA